MDIKGIMGEYQMTSVKLLVGQMGIAYKQNLCIRRINLLQGHFEVFGTNKKNESTYSSLSVSHK